MKSISAGMQTMLNCAGGARMTLTTLMQITRRDATVFRFCAHNTNVIYGGNTYRSALGYSRSDTVTSDELDVDNMNVHGPLLTDDGITDADVRAGLWDFAKFRIFMVNYQNTADGEIKVRRGSFGEITTGRNGFEAELRGMMQGYQQSIGRIYQPDCDAVLGDSRCGIDLDAGSQPFTVTGTVEDVSADGFTVFDSARTEAGPADGVDISNITQADPGVVTTAATHGFIEGQGIILADVGGMTAANGAQVVRNPTADTFEIVKTTDFAAYTSGGTATPFDDAGWFDFGLMTMVDGPSAGLSREVKAYVPGMWTLQEPFPFGIEAGNAYSMKPGCDKTRATCVAKFDNVVRFRGFPDLRGNDALVQVGRHQ